MKVWGPATDSSASRSHEHGIAGQECRKGDGRALGAELLPFGEASVYEELKMLPKRGPWENNGKGGSRRMVGAWWKLEELYL